MRKKNKHISVPEITATISIGFAIAKFIDGTLTLETVKKLIAINQIKEPEYYDDSDLRI